MASTSPVQVLPNSDAELSAEQLDNLKSDLVSKQLELTQAVEALNGKILARQDCSIADAAEAAYLREEADRALGVAEEHNRTLLEISAALERMKNGSYGVCEVSGEPIGYPRLQLIPWASCGTEGSER